MIDLFNYLIYAVDIKLNRKEAYSSKRSRLDVQIMQVILVQSKYLRIYKINM